MINAVQQLTLKSGRKISGETGESFLTRGIKKKKKTTKNSNSHDEAESDGFLVTHHSATVASKERKVSGYRSHYPGNEDKLEM